MENLNKSTIKITIENDDFYQSVVFDNEIINFNNKINSITLAVLPGIHYLKLTQKKKLSYILKKCFFDMLYNLITQSGQSIKDIISDLRAIELYYEVVLNEDIQISLKSLNNEENNLMNVKIIKTREVISFDKRLLMLVFFLFFFPSVLFLFVFVLFLLISATSIVNKGFVKEGFVLLCCAIALTFLIIYYLRYILKMFH